VRLVRRKTHWVWSRGNGTIETINSTGFSFSVAQVSFHIYVRSREAPVSQ
jgi:hypothetical protein